MPLFSIQKNYKEKILTVFGFKIRLLRSSYKKSQKFYKNLPEKPHLQSDGFSLVSFWTESGESQVSKDFAHALDKSGVHYDVSDLNVSSLYPHFKSKITFTTSPYTKHDAYDETAVLFWEFESGMLEGRPYLFEDLKNVVVFSSFNYNYFKKVIPHNVRLVHMSYPFDFDTLPDETSDQTRAKYGISTKDFVVFFNFSYMSSYFRKNPEAILKVFKDTLSDKKNAKLIIKTQGSAESPHAKRFLDLISYLGLKDKVVLENENLSRVSMLNLINMCDVYMSLHRGEGLGLGMLEAMSMGKPVIATNYGGNTDFVLDNVAFPLNYRLVKPKELDFKVYQSVQKWAEPNLKQASDYLLKLYKNKKLREEIGQKAQLFVRQKFSLENFIQSLELLR